jgi:YHS domain-containing protein
MAIDPVCHMEVDETTAQWKSEYQGKMYYFCAPGCKASFEKDPEKYLGQSPGQDEHEHHGHH